MTVMKEESIGSSLEDWLKDEGLLEDARDVARKRVIAGQLSEAMTAQGISKAEMARRLETSRSHLDRILDPEAHYIQLCTLERMAQILGKRLCVKLVDAESAVEDYEPA